MKSKHQKNKTEIITTLNKRLIELDEIASEDNLILEKFENQFQELSRLVEEASYRLSNNKPIASALRSKNHLENFNNEENLKNLDNQNKKNLMKMKRTSISMKKEFLENMKKIEEIHYEEQKYLEEVKREKERLDKEKGGFEILKEEVVLEKLEEENGEEKKEEPRTIRERVKKMIKFCK